MPPNPKHRRRAVAAALEKSVRGRRGGKIQEDDPRWNPLTMGNKTYGGTKGYPKVMGSDFTNPRRRRKVGRKLMKNRRQ